MINTRLFDILSNDITWNRKAVERTYNHTEISFETVNVGIPILSPNHQYYRQPTTTKKVEKPIYDDKIIPAGFTGTLAMQNETFKIKKFDNNSNDESIEAMLKSEKIGCGVLLQANPITLENTTNKCKALIFFPFHNIEKANLTEHEKRNLMTTGWNEKRIIYYLNDPEDFKILIPQNLTDSVSAIGIAEFSNSGEHIKKKTLIKDDRDDHDFEKIAPKNFIVKNLKPVNLIKFDSKKYNFLEELCFDRLNKALGGLLIAKEAETDTSSTTESTSIISPSSNSFAYSPTLAKSNYTKAMGGLNREGVSSGSKMSAYLKEQEEERKRREAVKKLEDNRNKQTKATIASKKAKHSNCLIQ